MYFNEKNLSCSVQKSINNPSIFSGIEVLRVFAKYWRVKVFMLFERLERISLISVPILDIAIFYSDKHF